MKKFKMLTVLFLCLFVTACSQQTITINDISGEILEETAINPILTSPTPGSRLLAAGTKSITFTVTTQDPSIVKADTSNKTFSSMTKTAIPSNNNRTHTFTFSLQENRPYTFYIRAAPQNNPSNPYNTARRVHYRVISEYNPSYPRTFSLWWPQWNEWQEATSERLASLSVFIVNLHGYNRPDGFQPIDPQVFNQARQLNPSLRILTQFYSTYGCTNENAMCDELEQYDSDPNHPLYQKVFVRNADGSLFDGGDNNNGEQIHTVYNFASPEFVSWWTSKNLQLWRTDLLTFDGAFMDNCWRELEDTYLGSPDNVDLNLDGVADNKTTRISSYEKGLQQFLSGLRKGMPNAVILCNADGVLPEVSSSFNTYKYSQVINGIEGEGDLFDLSQGNYFRSTTEFLRLYKDWNSSQGSMNMLPNKVIADGASNVEVAYQTLREMRYGLALTLMGDGLHLHGGWGYYTYFDEYDAELGYATQGFGAPIASGSPVWRRNFDNGIALVNTNSTQSITVNLGGTYKAVQGTQDPMVNNGKTMTRVTIPPLDGRILLKP